MAMQVENHQDAPVSTLVSGIVQDAQKLFVEQMTLFQVEFKHDMQRTWMALVPVVIGLAVLLTAFFLLGMGASHLLCTVLPELPLWGGYMAVGIFVAIGGTLLTLWGKSMLADVKPVDTALKGLEENVKWKTKN